MFWQLERASVLEQLLLTASRLESSQRGVISNSLSFLESPTARVSTDTAHRGRKVKIRVIREKIVRSPFTRIEVYIMNV